MSFENDRDAYNRRMAASEPLELIEFLAPYPDQLKELTLQGRELLAGMFPGANEIFYDANSAVCSGFVYTDSVRDCFVNLAVYSDHVTLIFGFGAALSDPEHRLKGGGNQVRHLRLAGIETLKDPYVAELIMQASDRSKRPAESQTPHRIVKVMNGKKRRPQPSSK
jgi:hypothetical protein